MRKLSQSEIFRALAVFVEKERLRDICVIELEGGVVVQGYALVETREGWTMAPKTKTLSHQDLANLLKGG